MTVPGMTRVAPNVIEAVATIGRVSMDKAIAHIIWTVFGDGCTLKPSRRPRSSGRADEAFALLAGIEG